MSQIKKGFVDLVNLLESNKNKKVSDILPLVLEMATSKKIEKTFIKDDNGNVVQIFCYYHKQWEDVAHYGKKASSHTGYNTMCKQGVNQWTKQQSEAKSAKAAMLEALESGKLQVSEIATRMAEIEAHRNRIEPRVEA